MEYYIKIKPKYKVSTYSKYSYDKLSLVESQSIQSITHITHNDKGESYKHGGYVKCLYGENEYRYVVYENVPSFGHIMGKFKTMVEAVSYIDGIRELEEM